MNGSVRREDCFASGDCSRLSAAAKFFPIIDARLNAGDTFVVERTPLPAVRNTVGVGPDFVGSKFLQMLALAVGSLTLLAAVLKRYAPTDVPSSLVTHIEAALAG